MDFQEAGNNCGLLHSCGIMCVTKPQTLFFTCWWVESYSISLYPSNLTKYNICVQMLLCNHKHTPSIALDEHGRLLHQFIGNSDPMSQETIRGWCSRLIVTFSSQFIYCTICRCVKKALECFCRERAELLIIVVGECHMSWQYMSVKAYKLQYNASLWTYTSGMWLVPR